MSKIKVDSKCALYDGMSITFKAPCDSSAVDGMNVYYQNKKQTFTYRDAHGNNVSGRANLFSTGAYVKAILDTGKGYAYIQNADTNGYWESTFDDFSTNTYTKSEVLSDSTKALYSKTADAVPDDLFHQLGEYNLHWWSKEPVPTYQDVIVENAISSDVKLLSWYPNNQTTIKYSSNVSIVSGKISLDNPKTKTIYTTGSWGDQRTQANSLLALAPCYFTTSVHGDGKVFFLPEGANYYNGMIGTCTYPADYTLCITTEYIEEEDTDACYVTANYRANNPVLSLSIVNKLVTGDIEYLKSMDSNAYPVYGEIDGFLYKYLGIPENNMINATKIEHGSYVGTGRYGSANRNSLTFGFVPKVVIISNYNSGTRPAFVNGQSTGPSFSDTTTNVQMSLEWRGNILLWYASNSASQQLNNTNVVYYYVAIG